MLFIHYIFLRLGLNKMCCRGDIRNYGLMPQSLIQRWFIALNFAGLHILICLQPFMCIQKRILRSGWLKQKAAVASRKAWSLKNGAQDWYKNLLVRPAILLMALDWLALRGKDYLEAR